MIANHLNFDDDVAAFADGAIGGGLSPQVGALITQAGLLRHLPLQALPLLEQARTAAPRHPAPLIALYRFHFYGHDLVQARSIGEDALAIARTALGPKFGDEPPGDAATLNDAAVRFYLFTLKGLAYLNMRLDELDEAQRMLKELRRLEPPGPCRWCPVVSCADVPSKGRDHRAVSGLPGTRLERSKAMSHATAKHDVTPIGAARG